jgi:catechol 2,3-dioxygenase-like lactoylglutathione lyase family enzyme
VSARPEHIVGISMICFDAREPATLAAFWAALLGGERVVDEDGDAWVELASGPRLDFLQVPEEKTGKNRLHLDVHATDVAAATTEALALGATRADDIYDGNRWQVLRDPEGNEFCLLPPQLSTR